jgi:hypothetical protein
MLDCTYYMGRDRELLLSRTLVVSMAFIAMTLSSTAYVSLATINYLQFYPAIDRLDANVTKLIFVPGTGSNQATVVASVAVSNPTDYSGFKVRGASVQMYFFEQTNRNNTLFDTANKVTGSAVPTVQISPNSVYSLDLTVSLSSTQSNDLSKFYANYSSQGVVGVTNLRVDISTFLVAATGTTVLDRVQNVTLTS